MLLFLTFGMLLIAALVSLLPKMSGRSLRWTGLASSVLTLCLTFWSVGPVFLGWASPQLTSWWDVSRFASLMGILVAWLYACAMLVSLHYLHVEERKGIVSIRQM